MHSRPPSFSALACVFFFGLAGALAAQESAPAGRGNAVTNELDAFMEKVLARREVNRKTLEQYVLDETESFEVLGPGRTALYRSKRDFTWYVRDGMHVRSPVRFNGVAVPEDDRQRYEANWTRRERARQARKLKKEPEQQDGREIALGPDGVQIGAGVIPAEPRFVSEAYFMDFKFEPGNYYLAGREQLEGQEVLRIEYYPTRMFGDEERRKRRAGSEDPDKNGGRGDDARQQREREIERQMNKTALITLWVDPKLPQIVRYTFENVWLDFLPAAWLVKVDDIRASMTMGQPFPGVWLPREIGVHASVTMANGSFEATAERQFTEYRLAEVEMKLRVPKRSRMEPSTSLPQSLDAAAQGWRDRVAPFDEPALEAGRQSGPFAGEQDPQTAHEILGEVRIHGNAYLGDREVLELAGIEVGQRIGPADVENVTKRLKDSGRFESVEVRKRYRSLTSSSDVALVLIVHEKPGVGSNAGATGPEGAADVLRRRAGWLRSRIMVLPIVRFDDGYGFTYGGRMSTVDTLGIGERLSVPLTWGGTRRAALEFERLFRTGPLTRIDSSVAVWSRENPRFEIRDRRIELRGRAERVFADMLRTSVEASRSTIRFGTVDDRLWTLGTSATFDTRLDPAYPGNAVLLSAGWTGLHFREIQGRVNRYTADARGYLRVFRQIVLAARAQYAGADSGLPPYERLLLGGASSVRGFRTGSFDGDRTLIASAEVRVPVTSVLSGAKLGITGFFDAGKAWDAGQSAAGADWHRGAGGGIFLIASVLRINLDVARGLRTGRTRVHLSSGFTF